MDNCMKLMSWNVNGLRACMNKGFFDFLRAEGPDVLCVQETKMREGQQEVPAEGYLQYWCSAERKGYSGTLMLVREETMGEPLSVTTGIGVEEHDHEGRVITAGFPDFYLVDVYTPNSQDGLKRLSYRMEWEDAFRAYLKGLESGAAGPARPVIVCGDMNVAHEEIDLKNPKTNRKNPGFSDEERAMMTKLLDDGFIDTFRYFYPDTTGAYSWWSYRFNARANNAGWRIDYFLVSRALEGRLRDAKILTEVYGSDHCPVSLEIGKEESDERKT